MRVEVRERERWWCYGTFAAGWVPGYRSRRAFEAHDVIARAHVFSRYGADVEIPPPPMTVAHGWGVRYRGVGGPWAVFETRSAAEAHARRALEAAG